MANWLTTIAGWIKNLRFWFLVLPWQAALRVRMGSRIREFGPGVHFKLPWIDQVFVQGLRTVVLNLPNQTVTCTDEKPVTISAVVSYRLTDLRKAYDTTYSIRDWIFNSVLTATATYVSERASTKVEFATAGLAIQRALSGGEDRGILVESIGITDLIKAKTYRFVMDSPSAGFGDVHGSFAYTNDQGGAPGGSFTIG